MDHKDSSSWRHDVITCQSTVRVDPGNLLEIADAFILDAYRK